MVSGAKKRSRGLPDTCFSSMAGTVGKTPGYRRDDVSFLKTEDRFQRSKILDFPLSTV